MYDLTTLDHFADRYDQLALCQIPANLIIFAALMLVDLDAFMLAMGQLSAIDLLSIGWLWANYGLAQLAIGWLSTIYWLPIGYLSADYWLAIRWPLAGYQQAISWQLDGYWLAISWLLSIIWLTMGWLWAASQLSISWLHPKINTLQDIVIYNYVPKWHMAVINTLDCSVFTRFFGQRQKIGWLLADYVPKSIHFNTQAYILCTKVEHRYQYF